MIFNMTGGGGNPLNFKVVGGTSQPGSPKENTIWINTSTTITDWVFSATQPTAASGRVWISTGTSSSGEFNALKKNGIQVYPLSAKQYVSGAWVDKTPKIYQNGKWVGLGTYLYDKGNECTDITGGWALSTNYDGTHGDTLTKNATSMIFSSVLQMNVHNANGFLQAKNKIDLTNVTTVEAVLNSATINAVSLYLCVKDNDQAVATNMKASTAISNGAKIVQLDVSGLDGKFYVGIAASRGGETKSSVEISQIILK